MRIWDVSIIPRISVSSFSIPALTESNSRREFSLIERDDELTPRKRLVRTPSWPIDRDGPRFRTLVSETEAGAGAAR